MMMSENYKIIAKFIKDMSSETPDTETYIFVKENIFKYQLGININSKPLKNQVIEINTNLKFEDKEDNKMKSFFEISYVTIIKVNEQIKDKKLIIHNAEFDLSHLNNELKLLNKKGLENDVIDTLILARDKFPGSSVSLDALCKRYRIDNSKRVQHTALIDCELLSKVYINLIDQKEPTFNLVNNENDLFENNDNKILYFKKVISIKEEEITKHKDYLKSNLKKNFFN